MNDVHAEKERTIVIGGGLAGLLAACKLARAGGKVLLLERSPQLGGRARSITKHGGRMNLGAHAYYLGGAFEQSLLELGVQLQGAAPPSSQAQLLWGGKLVSLPRLVASGTYLSLAEKAELVRVMVYIARLKPASIERMSLREFAERTTLHPSVRNVLYALMRTASYTLNPDGQLARPVVSQLKRTFQSGILYLHGGWQSIIDQLERKFQEAGGQLLLGQSVKQVEHEGGRVTGVRMADGSFLAAQAVILTASPAENMRLVRDGSESILRRWKEQALPSTVASLDITLRQLPVAGRNFVVGIDQPLFFTNNSTSAKLTEDGSQVIHLTKYHGISESDPKADEQQLESVMDFLHPGWRQQVVAKQYLPRITVVHDYPHIGSADSNRGPDVPEIMGLYAAGDWLGHEDELLSDAAAASAERAARRVLQFREHSPHAAADDKLVSV
ncbi:phytoene dehydrogenase-like protein [Paenibacillus phyllosphaerae]|uniref:Phytoene dehydrogenase-like protein n=1 Tax=Paenibacillus phyllosphaerae TaxID=274593 RepID=A0A7W5B514_9BACL|nr:FAD-dependent oxidoreductase [Paenibacillus phyllosphaerae]MBB3114529.1 phytoene dehydrogenase-like protein [Paenibacillus phyllosphaerae]